MLLTSCTDFDWHDDHNAGLSSFTIEGPTDLIVEISEDRSDIDETVTISWNPCQASDYSTVFYKVVFSPTGDFEHPAYEIETSQLSTSCTAEITKRELNIMAERSGVKQNASGSVKWSVMASNGLVSKLSDSEGSITVSRPGGYAYNPEYIALYSDGGQLGMMRRISDGVFELFAKLSGSCELREMASTIDRSFGITGTVLEEGGVLTPVESGSFHHIVIDFNTATASLKSIEEVGLWYSGENKVVARMTATGDAPIWECQWHFDVVDEDYRYKFHLSEKDADGNLSELFYGYSRRTAANQSASSPLSYFQLYVEDGLSQSDFCFRFGRNNYQAGHTLGISVDFSADIEAYTHTVVQLD